MNGLSVIFWSIFGIFISVFFYQAFNQPILFDRAYLLYMSQVVSRGDSLYESTTFGYTPFSTVAVGLIMKAGQILSLNTIVSARLFGILFFGAICSSFYYTFSVIYNKVSAGHLAAIFISGMGFLSIISGINAEPKLWVLLFSTWGIFFFHKNNWLIIGIMFTLAAMCWHASIISLLPVLILLPWRSIKIRESLMKLVLGGIIGAAPVLFYLLITDSWIDFWNQAVIRKILVEGESLGNHPFLWLFRAIYPYFLTESLHFVLAFFGFFWLFFTKTFSKSEDFAGNTDSRTNMFLYCYTITWSIFNSLEFQGPPDIIPMLPALIYYIVFFIIHLKSKLRSTAVYMIVGLCLVCYNYYDLILYQNPFTYAQQKQLIDGLEQNIGDPFVIGFEEYYVINEKRMPSKYMRLAPYESHLVESGKLGFVGLKNLVRRNHTHIVTIEKEKSQRQFGLLPSSIVNKAKKQKNTESHFERYLIENLTNGKSESSFEVLVQVIPLGRHYTAKKVYSIYAVK